MKRLKNAVKYAVSLCLCLSIVFAFAACSSQPTAEVSDLPLVFSDDSVLKYIPAGSEKPIKVCDKFNEGSGSVTRAKLSGNGKALYYIQSASEGSLIGTLYRLDISKEGAKPKAMHENVYSFEMTADESTVIIMEGSGKLLKFDKSKEKKNNYDTIEDSLVTSVKALSKDGKYVLYEKVINGNAGVYSICLAKTDFKQTNDTRKMKKEQILKNTSINTAPVVVSENKADIVYTSDDLSTVYYTNRNSSKDSLSYTVGAFKKYKNRTVVSKNAAYVYGADKDGTLIYSEAKKGAYKVEDVVADKNAVSDKKMKKPAKSDSKATKAYNKKKSRDKIRKSIKNYLDNFTTTTFYSYGVKSSEPKKVCSYTGQVYNCASDMDEGLTFISATDYAFKEKDKQISLEKVTSPYEDVFSDIRNQFVASISADEVVKFEPEKEAQFNGADVYVDTVNKRISAIFDFDGTKSFTGDLYTAKYTSKGFDKAEAFRKVKSILKVPSADTSYYVCDKSVYAGDKTISVPVASIVSSAQNLPVVLANEKKNGTYSAYLIKGDKVTKLGKAVDKFVSKGEDIVYYSEYSVKGDKTAYLISGEKTVELGKNVTYIMNY